MVFKQEALHLHLGPENSVSAGVTWVMKPDNEIPAHKCTGTGIRANGGEAGLTVAGDGFGLQSRALGGPS